MLNAPKDLASKMIFAYNSLHVCCGDVQKVNDKNVIRNYF
jgi:hypothetical protein